LKTENCDVALDVRCTAPQSRLNVTPLLGTDSRELKPVVGAENSDDFRVDDLLVDVYFLFVFRKTEDPAVR